MNRIRLRRHDLGALWQLDRAVDLHTLLYERALADYLALAKARGHAPGQVLAIGASHREAEALRRHPFERIVLTGVVEPDARIERVLARDPRVHYELASGEALPYPPHSFDLVFAKAVLHHLPRPVLGLYEMLRVCRRAAILVEPWETPLVRGLERLGIASRYEREQDGNPGARDNHVYRWSRRSLEALLRSLYLESGFVCDLTVGWLSTRVQGRGPRGWRRLVGVCAWAASWCPGAEGNLVTALIVPGCDRPPDP